MAADAPAVPFEKAMQRQRRGDVCAPPHQIAEEGAPWCAEITGDSIGIHQDVPGCGRVCSSGNGDRGVKDAANWPSAPCSACPDAEWATCAGAGCLKMTTGTGTSHDGFVNVYVDQGSGFVAVNAIPLSGGNDDDAKNLQACVGECDNDSQCAGALQCYQRDNTDAVPGCLGAGTTDWDYCYNGQP